MIKQTQSLEKGSLKTISDAYSLYKLLSKDSFVLMYMGVFDDELTTILMDINDAGKFEMKSSRKKISFLIAECFQNIVRHADADSKAAVGFQVPEMFLMRNRKSVHHLVTTNVVRSQDRIKLSENIDQLKDMSKDDLKQMYLNVFKNIGHSEKGGAGLGLIEMARKSGTAPTYRFEDLGGGLSNFFFQVNALPSDFDGIVTEKEISIQPAIAIYEKMTEQKIVLLQKGDFSKEVIMPLIKLFESNLQLKAEDVEIVRRVVTLLVEMLENISQHAREFNGMREGIFYVSERESGQYEVNTGNFIPVSQSLILKERLESIAKWADETKAGSNAASASPSDGDKFIPGPGLVEICKNSSGKLVYDFKPIGHSLTFFSLKVNL